MNKMYYNTIKPDVSHIHTVGCRVSFSSKCGGGEYVVIGHINCERCNNILEEREWIEPTRKQKKNGSIYQVSCWCFKCGLWQPKKGTKKIINQL